MCNCLKIKGVFTGKEVHVEIRYMQKILIYQQSENKIPLTLEHTRYTIYVLL